MGAYETDAISLINNRLAQLERRIEFLFQTLKLEYREAIPPYLSHVADLLRLGKKQEALDACAETTGAGIAEVKALVADLERVLRNA
jgi:hypothetical protein